MSTGRTTPRQETAVTKTRPNPPLGERGFAFDFDSAVRFATGLVESGMVPRGITKPGAVVGLIEAGRELGLQPMYALANLTFTNGRLGIMGDAAKALIRSRGMLEPGTDFTPTYSGDENTATWTCTVTAHRKGFAVPFSASFSIADAIAAKLVRLNNGKIQSRSRDGWSEDGPWATYTKRMLMYRALGFLCRDYFSDVLGGAVIAEELRDYPDAAGAATPHASPVATPASEPDPLLVAAVAADEIHEAEVVEDTSLSPDEQALATAAERLEGQIVTAESLQVIESAWVNASSLLQSLPSSVRERLTDLYQHHAAAFKP